ncbi:MAG TPA: folylpolyglutamate synthase/dihydrofolate synthase family protein [Streptosporangiaceae bacterium]|nr:folylpolyglutamate synthase/dihydrofolate synthase family protein [Streptosporangiaceae bacterium]
MTDTDERARLREVEREILARRPEHAIDPTLDRISELVTLLGDPHRAYPVIHITGTNGKTSTARMTERLLRERGLRTGLFTSPHLSSIRERICVDGEPVSAQTFIAAYEEIQFYLDLVDGRQPARLSFFEVLTGMAFAIFADAPVDVAVIEVGMGGTWDSTNVADGAVAVVTPIAIDHTRYLGETVEQIAADKAGIIKPGAIAVIAQQPPAAAEVLLRRAADVGATVAREGLEFGVLSRELAIGGQQIVLRGLLGDYDGLFLPLFGAHQAGNLACALAAVEAFARADPVGAPASPVAEHNGHEPDDGEAARRGLAGLGQPSPEYDGPAIDGPGFNGTESGNSGLDAAGRSGAGLQEAGQRGGGMDSAALDRIGLDRLEAARLGGDAGAAPLDISLVREAVAAMSSPGRLEVVRRSPVVVVDAAHNPAGMAATVAALEEAFGFSELIAIVAVSEDKDVPGILDQLEPVAARLVATTNSSGRAMDAEDLADAAEPIFGEDRISVAERLDDAIEIGVALADEADAGGDGGPGGLGGAVVLITGSVMTAGEARLLLTRRAGRDRP